MNSKRSPISHSRTVHSRANTSISNRVTVAIVIDLCSLHLRTMAKFVFAHTTFLYQLGKSEFGAKLHISLVDGYARIERLDFEAYNESEDFWNAVSRYRDRYGCWPERVLADKIYRNRQTLSFCKEHGIRLSGPRLGKPPKDQQLSRQLKKQEYQDARDRNAVEGVFGTGKTAYGLGRISARLQQTTCCVIGMALLLLNLMKRLSSLFRALSLRLFHWPFPLSLFPHFMWVVE